MKHISPDIPDGIYDNLSNMCRERWKGGRLIGRIFGCFIADQVKIGLPVEPFKHYPDTPRVGK